LPEESRKLSYLVYGVYSQISIARQSLAAANDVCGLRAGCLGDLLPPSPPAEKAAAHEDQTGQSSTRDRAGYGSWIIRMLVFGGRQRAGNNEVTIAALGIKNLGGIAITGNI
jgi:hypothetical protein